MKVKIINDGKLREDSWEAHTEIDFPTIDDSYTSPLSVDAYGKDEGEARANLYAALGRVLAIVAEAVEGVDREEKGGNRDD